MNMKAITRKLILLFVILIPLTSIAQEAKKDDKTSVAGTREKRKKAKAKWKETRKIEHENKKAVKQHHKRLQTKKTRKEMKKEKRKSDKLRENKKSNFFSRLFGR